MSELTTSARQAANSSVMSGLARFGLVARAVVYLLIGWLALQIALGHGQHEANQRGAMAEIAHKSHGTLLLWVLGAGLAAYAIWRLSEAAFGTAAEGNKASARLKSLVRGIVYGGFAVLTFSFIAGTSQQSQSHQQVALTARVMRHDFGRWLVAVAGVVVVIVGLGQIVEGFRKKFEKQLRMDELTGTTRTWVVRLGVVGTVARGVVFALAGLLVVDAAITFDPAKSTGLDGALRTLADQPLGPLLLGVVALGLIAFGVFGLAAARYAKT